MTNVSLKKREATMQRYLAFMKDIKARLAVVKQLNELVNDKKLVPIAAEEFGYLQVRMICELIAMACLTAHDEIPAIRKIQMSKDWQPNKIFSKLENLHPDFYPQAGDRITDQSGKPVRLGTAKEHRMIKSKKDYLTKKELVIVAGKCGARLHLGPYKNLFTDREPDFSILYNWLNKIVLLLSFHRIMFYDPKYSLWVAMEPDEGTDPICGLMEVTTNT